MESLFSKRCRATLLSLALCTQAAHAAWQTTAPRELKPGEIAVEKPGVCDKEGATYVLTRDLVAPASGLFLAKNVTLDLNGHTLTYAAGYQGVANCSFEEDLKGWDVSMAPGAQVKDLSLLHPLVGKKVCLLPKGQELVSPYVNLPVAGRAYYAMAAVAWEGMDVGIFVEDEQGKSIECAFKFGNNTRPCCPEPNRTCKLGGGTVFALMFGQSAGKYRIRVKAVNKDCIIDEVDLRPALDVGVGIVEKTLPWAYYKCILDGDSCAFFDYTEPNTQDQPKAGIPVVHGEGTVTVRNGVIKLGSKAIRTWGLQSTASDVRVELDNVKFEAAGINTYAVDAPFGTLKNCRVELDTPWIIDRHRQQDYGVALMGANKPSDVSDSEFIGGQGQLTVRGDNSKIHDNLFVNKQHVVNHYSCSPGGNNTKVYKNKFQPEQGSGILIFKQQGVEVCENEFRIEASPPVNEYAQADYSVSAIRVTDYDAKKGDAKGWCGNNTIHHNKIQVIGHAFPQADAGYKPMVYGIFMSVGGEQNFVHDNAITVEQKDGVNDEKHGAYALYIGGSENGGTYTDNTIISNVTPVWIGTMYGPAANASFRGNTFRKAPGASDFVPIVLGWYKFPTHNVGFYGNKFEGMTFQAEVNDYTTNYVSEYEFGWLLTVKTAPNAEVIVLDKSGKEVIKQKADDKGVLVIPLAEYKAAGQGQFAENGKQKVKIARTDVSAYTIKANGKDKTVSMTADVSIEL